MSDTKTQDLAALVHSRGWTDILDPALRGEIQKCLLQLQIEPDLRPEPQLSDAFLRGYLAGMKFALERPGQWLGEALANASNPNGSGPQEPVGSPYEPETEPA